MSWLREILTAGAKLFQWWVIVAPWEQGVRVRGGKNARLLEPGVRFRIPFWDRVYRQSLRERVVGVPPQTLTFTDGKAITMRIVVMYSIADLLQVYNTLEEVHAVVSGEAAGILSEYISGRDSTAFSVLQAETIVEDNIDLEAYGLTPGRVRVTDAALVRTYRLISGDGDNGFWGGGFNTNRYDNGGSNSE